ncbi:hypothetical protein [Streptomyces winkii]|uniref:hypothetical protein n=1 Tax=Streptomyces winkii TaxID=3051178 RepID=UPI0028D0C619|nr:hypothetical protein [Streptomyces sp. DSM 40971]
MARQDSLPRLIPLVMGFVLATLLMCCCVSHGQLGDAHHRAPKTSAAVALTVTAGSDAPDDEHHGADCVPSAISRPIQPLDTTPATAMTATTLSVAFFTALPRSPSAIQGADRPIPRSGRSLLADVCLWRI